MSRPKKSTYLQQPFILLGKLFNEVKRVYREHFAESEPIRIVVFQGHGRLNGLFRVSGRVLEGEPHQDPAVDAPLEDNIRDMLSRMASKQIAYAQVSCHADLVPDEPQRSDKRVTGEMFDVASTRVESTRENTYTVYCDKEGYFTIEGASQRLVQSPHELWHPIPIRLEWPERKSQSQTTFIGRCQIPQAPQFGVISDIDDTIMYTGATRLRTMLKTTMSDNARSRRPFTGVVPFYQGLQHGTKGTRNPFFYVSSSPWNLYDFLVSFLNFHKLPQGTLYLRDLAIGRQKGSVNRHEIHKLNAIDSVMELHPDLKFILVGDSGQHDPFIYSKVVAKYPNRVLAIIIRDVTGTHRHAELARLVRRVEQQYKVPMLLEPDMSWPAQFAERRGWIEPSYVTEVNRAIHRSLSEPLVRVQRKLLRRSTKNALLFGVACGATLASLYFLRRYKKIEPKELLP